MTHKFAMESDIYKYATAYDSNFFLIPEKCHNNIKSKYYVRPKSDAICFAIHHFAGRVVYYADGFLEKNRNFLPAEGNTILQEICRKYDPNCIFFSWTRSYSAGATEPVRYGTLYVPVSHY